MRITFRMGRYAGRGDDPADAIYGEHAPQPSPLHYLPMTPAARAKNWDFIDVLSQFSVSATDGAATLLTTLEGAAPTYLLGAGGVTSLTGAADNNANHTALSRKWALTANKIAGTVCRVTFPSADLAQNDFTFGWGNAILDIDSKPSHGAYFAKEDGAATFVARSKDGTTESDTAQTSITAVAWDLGVVINGTSSVDFYYKLATEATWTRTNKTTNLPAAAQNMRAAMSWQNGDANARSLVIERWYTFMEKVA